MFHKTMHWQIGNLKYYKLFQTLDVLSDTTFSSEPMKAVMAVSVRMQ